LNNTYLATPLIRNMNKKNSSLVIYWKQLGDLVLMEPTFSKLAASTKSDIYVATNSEFGPLLSLMENVYLAPVFLLSNIKQVFSFDHRLRACIKSLLTRSSCKYLILSNQKYLKLWHKYFYTDIEMLEPSSKYRAKYFFDSISQTSEMSFRPPKLKAPPEIWKPSYLPPKYIIIHPTSAWKNKSWSSRSWVSVIDALNKIGAGPFLITGGKSLWEIEFAESIVKQSKCQILNLCGKTDIQEYLSIIFNSTMVLSIDGSAAQIAAAFNRPNLTLFGPSAPLHWHWPSKISRTIDARNFSSDRKPSVDSIPPEVCIEEAKRIWKLTL
jgi:ADP-heptose:LPS heptosyltransferase